MHSCKKHDREVNPLNLTLEIIVGRIILTIGEEKDTKVRVEDC